MVFWAREKIKNIFEEAQREARLEGESKRDLAWLAWYKRMQAAQRDGVPFDEPPPVSPGHEGDS